MEANSPCPVPAVDHPPRWPTRSEARQKGNYMIWFIQNPLEIRTHHMLWHLHKKWNIGTLVIVVWFYGVWRGLWSYNWPLLDKMELAAYLGCFYEPGRAMIQYTWWVPRLQGHSDSTDRNKSISTGQTGVWVTATDLYQLQHLRQSGSEQFCLQHIVQILFSRVLDVASDAMVVEKKAFLTATTAMEQAFQWTRTCVWLYLLRVFHHWHSISVPLISSLSAP